LETAHPSPLEDEITGDGQVAEDAPAQCETCFPSQGFFDLIPIFGLLRRGKACDKCGERTQRRWPTVELLMAATWGLVVYQNGLTSAALVLALFCGVLVYLAMTDYETTWFPGGVLFAAVLLGLALFPFSPLGQDWSILQA
jgi:leader peptidase (prepilin peptidase)/N-methyltransferase